ncbi:MAG: DUF6580 family putative transport protein, partial [Bacteroidia bacterium]
MNPNKIQIKTPFIGIFILLAAFSRIIPHPTNFSPLAAISLLGGLYIAQKH